MKYWRKKDRKYRAIILCNLLDKLSAQVGGLHESIKDVTNTLMAMLAPKPIAVPSPSTDGR